MAATATVTEQEKPAATCDFPSASLLAFRRRIVIQAGVEPDAEKVRTIMQTVLKIDQLRVLHEEIDDCSCWYREADRSYRAEKG